MLVKNRRRAQTMCCLFSCLALQISKHSLHNTNTLAVCKVYSFIDVVCNRHETDEVHPNTVGRRPLTVHTSHSTGSPDLKPTVWMKHQNGEWVRQAATWSRPRTIIFRWTRVCFFDPRPSWTADSTGAWCERLPSPYNRLISNSSMMQGFKRHTVWVWDARPLNSFQYVEVQQWISPTPHHPYW